MDFEFSEEQLALRDVCRDLFAKQSSPERLRAIWDGGERGTDLWRSLAEMGVLGLTVPEDHGGMGGNLVDLLLVLEEAGYHAVPDPLLETVVVAAPALRWAEEGEWLERIAAGEAVISARLGGSPYVVDADIADAVLIEHEDGLGLVTEFDATLVPTEDRARRLFAIEVTGDVQPVGASARRAWERGALGAAALLNGIGRRLLDLSVEYAQARQQFDRPIGSFQAVSHKLATLFIQNTAAHSATRYAAYAEARDTADRPVAISTAKAYASDAAALANTEALQIHAGIGFTWEHDLHFWLKRGRALEQAYGSPRDHRRRLAEHVLALAGDEPPAPTEEQADA